MAHRRLNPCRWGRHPLTQFVFDSKGDMMVATGSETDNCADPNAANSSAPCAEAEGKNPRGAIRKYQMKWPEGKVAGWEIFARGLRNSMALAIEPGTDKLWQGENSRDGINNADPSLSDAALPHDEINLILKNGHYGWPYCFDENRAAPEFKGWDCKNYVAPKALLPPHGPPLGMTFYTGKLFPEKYQNRLIVALHGYWEGGHRLIAYEFNNGMPSKNFIELVSGWGSRNRIPKGAPVDVKVGADGAVYLTEDRNGTVLRFTYIGK